MTSDSTIALRPGRELSTYGGYGIDRQLRAMQNSPAVYWTKAHANSYVVAQEKDGSYRLISINGIGEQRWVYDPRELSWQGDEAREAANYFFTGIAEKVVRA